MEQVKLISVTLVLTLLIWTTAHQLVSETAEIDVAVRAESTNDDNVIVRTEPPNLNKFRITVTGPKRIVDELKEKVRAKELTPLTIEVPSDFEGPYRVDMKAALSASADQLRGLSVERVEPQEVRVFVDRLETITMPVHLETSLLDFDVPPRADPEQAQVTLANSDMDRLPRHALTIDADALLATHPEGEPLEIQGVPLPTQVNGVNLHVRPATVTVRATLRKQSKSGTIRAVPITVQASIENFNRFRVETRDGRTLISRAITVQGPPSVVDSLTSGRTPVTGRVILTGDMVTQAGQFVELPPVFDLPSAVRLAAPVAPVEVRLIPVESAAPK